MWDVGLPDVAFNPFLLTSLDPSHLELIHILQTVMYNNFLLTVFIYNFHRSFLPLQLEELELPVKDDESLPSLPPLVPYHMGITGVHLCHYGVPRASADLNVEQKLQKFSVPGFSVQVPAGQLGVGQGPDLRLLKESGKPKIQLIWVGVSPRHRIKPDRFVSSIPSGICERGKKRRENCSPGVVPSSLELICNERYMAGFFSVWFSQ